MGKKKKGPALAPAFAEADEDDAPALGALLAADAALVHSRNKDGWTPLHQAAYAGAGDCVALLLKAGADVKSQCRDGDLPLHYASAQGHVEICSELIRVGGASMLATTDNDGETPIDVAQSAKVKRALEALQTAAEDEAGDDDADEDEDDDGA